MNTTTPDFSSFLARCDRVEKERKSREDHALYLAILTNKSRQGGQFNRAAMRNESRKRFRSAASVPGRGHDSKNPMWGEGPHMVVRPGRYKKWED